MKTALDYLAGHWLAFGFIGAAVVVLTVAYLLRRRTGRAFAVVAGVGAGLALAGVGALALTALHAAAPVPLGWGLWLLATAAVVLFVLVVLLLLTGVWSKWAALAAGAAALFGFGGWALDSTGAALASGAVFLSKVRFVHTWWLLLLLVAPLTILISWRSLFRFESVRPWVAAVLRTAGIVLLALALAEPVAPQSGENVTVLFVVDRSLSVPAQRDPNDATVDLRQKRILRFLNEAVAKRNDLGHPRDRAGLIVFGKQPRLDLPPSDAPRFNLPKLPPVGDDNYTDIGAALKMALASFPDDTAKRIVLISDGNENRGKAEEQAKQALSMGVQIDVVPLAKGQRNEEEVLIERVQAPSLTEQGSKVPIRVLIRSYNPRRVGGTLTLRRSTEKIKDEPVGMIKVGETVPPLEYGLNPFSFPQPVGKDERSCTYEAEFVPEWYEDASGARIVGKPPGDRPENNKASAHVVASGRRNVLILEGKEKGDGQQRLERALTSGDTKFLVAREPIDVLNNYKGDQLQNFLRGFDCVILANVPEELVTAEQQERIRRNTEDQGGGLIMIGGPNSFGAGGWQDTPIEKALPVDCDIKSLKVQGRGGLVLIMHGCEMLDGNVWEKKIAKLAVQRLGPADSIGVIDGLERWHIPFESIADKRDAKLAQLDKLQPGDMPTFDNCLKMAEQALNKDDGDPEKSLATKHVIIISDGDPPCTLTLVDHMAAGGITVTTVGVSTHGGIENSHMQDIADRAPPKKGEKGHFYPVTDPSKLPAIYIQESRLVSQSFIEEKAFSPLVEFRRGPTEGLPDPVQQLRGYVRTTAKATALVEVPIHTPKWAEQEFPLLANWHYGLGKAVAFTSDAGTPLQWDRDWDRPDGMYDRFWQRVVDWSLRPTQSSRMRMNTDYRDGKIHITVDAQTDRGEPDTGLTVRGAVTPPHPGDDVGEKQLLRFVQTNSGRYEATVDAEDSGSYFVNAVTMGPDLDKEGKPILDKDGKPVLVPKDSIPPSAVTLPYSREFSEPEPNAPMMENLRDLTGGVSYADNDEALAKAAAEGVVFRPVPPPPGGSGEGMQPIWQWMLLLAAVLLLADVAVRRVSVDWQQAGEWTWRSWQRLRGIPLPPDNPEVLAQLQGRKAQTTAALEHGRARRRFEATGEYGPAPPGADATGPAPTPGARPAASRPDSPAPDAPEGGAVDALEALRRAKRRARGQDPDKPSP